MIQRRMIVTLLTAAICSAAAAQIRVVSYNIAGLDGDLGALQTVFNALMTDDKPGFDTIPSILIFQETQTPDSIAILNMLNAAAPPGVTYVRATFTSSPGEDSAAGAQALYYRQDVILEDPSGHVDIFTGAGRNADRWLLRPAGYTAPAARFYVYSCHLKSGNSAAEEAERASGATAIRTNANALPVGTNIIYVGDFNVYDNLEQPYLIMTGPGSGRGNDPYGTGPWAVPPSSNAIRHTQSPCLSGCALVGGGLDDRFDIQLSSDALVDGEGLSRMSTYRAFGNDGNHYNQDINAGMNTYYPGDAARSNALAAALHVASDHIPVISEYQVPAVMAATLPPEFGRVIQGAAVTIALQVSNDALVDVAAGADELDFSAVASGGLTGSVSGTVAALAGPAERLLGVVTNSVGPVSGSVLVTTSSQGAQNLSIALDSAGTVVAPSNPSFSAAADVDVQTLTRVFQVNSGVHTVMFDVFNHAWTPAQALLDLDGVSGLAAPFQTTTLPQPGISTGAAIVTITLDTNGRGDALYLDAFTVATSDENIPGESTHDLAATVSVRLRTFLGDVNNDCDVELADLAALLAGFGACKGQPAYAADLDLDNSGCVDLSDLATLLAEFGQTCP